MFNSLSSLYKLLLPLGESPPAILELSHTSHVFFPTFRNVCVCVCFFSSKQKRDLVQVTRSQELDIFRHRVTVSSGFVQIYVRPNKTKGRPPVQGTRSPHRPSPSFLPNAQSARQSYEARYPNPWSEREVSEVRGEL